MYSAFNTYIISIERVFSFIIIFLVEMTFDPAVYTINENVGLLSPTIGLSQPSPKAFNLIVTIMDINTTGNIIKVVYMV